MFDLVWAISDENFTYAVRTIEVLGLAYIGYMSKRNSDSIGEAKQSAAAAANAAAHTASVATNAASENKVAVKGVHDLVNSQRSELTAEVAKLRNEVADLTARMLDLTARIATEKIAGFREGVASVAPVVAPDRSLPQATPLEQRVGIDPYNAGNTTPPS